MALNNLWGKLGAFSRNVLVPSNVIYMLFDADFSPWADYLKAVNRKDTKRALDKELHNCHRFLANELNAIAALMRAGEVDSID